MQKLQKLGKFCHNKTTIITNKIKLLILDLFITSDFHISKIKILDKN